MSSPTPSVPEGLPVLARGRHLDPRDGSCLMEYVSVLAGERFSDRPRCTPPSLRWLAQRVNDAVSDPARTELVLRAPLLTRACPIDPTPVVLGVVARAGLAAGPEDRRLLAARRLGERSVLSWYRPGVRTRLLGAFLELRSRLGPLPVAEQDRSLLAVLDEVLDTVHPVGAVLLAARPGAR